MPHPRAIKRLEKDQADIDEQLSSLAASVEDCEKKMKELKLILYAKFGRSINLDD
jgi:prefoldin subunit 4